MNFSEALKAMRMGSKVAREAWRGKIAHWEIISILARDVLSQVLPDGATNNFAAIHQEDILADDWWIVT